MHKFLLTLMTTAPLLAGADSCIVSGSVTRSPASMDTKTVALDTKVSSCGVRPIARFDSLIWSVAGGSLSSFDSTRVYPLVIFIR